MKYTNLTKKKGIITPLFALSVVAVFSMIALAVDLGNAYLNKSRLQNLVDALALSAAVTLDQTGGNTTTAESDALITFNEFVASGTGNAPLSNNITFLTDIDFTYSELWAGAYIPSPGPANPSFVRVAITSFPSTVFFGGIFNVSSMNVTASAVAGPLAIQPCDIFPIGVCGTGDGADCSALNSDTCFGLPVHNAPAASDPLCINQDPTDQSHCTLNLLHESGGGTDIGPGNFNLLALAGTGASVLRDAFAGGFDDCNALNDAGTVETKTGVDWGPVRQGINTRFGIHENLMRGTEAIYPPDYYVADSTYTDNLTGTCTSGFCEYQDKYGPPAMLAERNDGKAKRRVIGVPVISCDGEQNGSGDVPLLGLICMFLSEHIPLSGEISGNIKPIVAEIAPIEQCDLGGVPTATTNFGVTDIYLYKDPLNAVDS